MAVISSEEWGDDMASAEREPITGVWGRSPQRGPGAEPLVRGQGESPLNFDNTITPLILHSFWNEPEKCLMTRKLSLLSK